MDPQLVVDASTDSETVLKLRRQVAFERLIAVTATRFINLGPERIDDAVTEALREIGEFTGVDRCYAFFFSPDGTRFACTHEWNAPGIAPQIDDLQDLPIADWYWSNAQILRGQVLHIPRVAELPAAAAFERQAFERQGIQSLLAVPMLYEGAVRAFLGFDAVRQLKTWSEEDIALLQVAGEVVVNAVEHKRAEEERWQESERRRRIAESLGEIVAGINAGLPLPEILERIVSRAAADLGAAACVLTRLDLVNEQSVHEASYSWPEALRRWNVIPFRQHHVTGSEDYRRALLRGEPTYGNYGPLPDRLDEIRDDPAIPPEIKARRLIIRTHFAGSMGVPLIVNGQVYGGLAFYYAQPQPFSADQVQLAQAFAGQAALAMANAQLRQQAAESAVAAERSRLARDLHDAVTQTLFSASLIAEVLPRIWERSPEEGQRRLAELRELTRGALAEMRTLLLELRPAALVEARLGDLLRQLGESITGRARVPVSVQVEGTGDIPVEVKVALYRIAQEALNNVAKHAAASQADVRLTCTPGRVELSVQDDGRGFDLDQVPPDHLGLGIMRERAEAVGARLCIDSRPGQGTQIDAWWPEETEKEGR